MLGKPLELAPYLLHRILYTAAAVSLTEYMTAIGFVSGYVLDNFARCFSTDYSAVYSLHFRVRPLDAEQTGAIEVVPIMHFIQTPSSTACEAWSPHEPLHGYFS